MDVIVYALLKKGIGNVSSLDSRVSVIEEDLDSINDKLEAVEGGLHYLGSVTDISSLPQSGTIGDAYTVEEEGDALFVWNGTEWIRWLDIATESQIDAMFI